MRTLAYTGPPALSIAPGPFSSAYRIAEVVRALTTKRIANIYQLHIDTWINRRAIPVGDMLVFVSDTNCTARVSDDVNSTTKIKSKVESCGSSYGDILAEIEKSSSTVRERLKRL